MTTDIPLDRRGVSLRCDGPRVEAVVVTPWHLGVRDAERKMNYAREVAFRIWGDGFDIRFAAGDIVLAGESQP